MPCNSEHIRHLDESRLATLDRHQKHDHGRHKCCQCAYNSGYAQGRELSTSIHLNIDELGDSQAERDGRHRSVHQAFALGYSDGVRDFIISEQ